MALKCTRPAREASSNVYEKLTFPRHSPSCSFLLVSTLLRKLFLCVSCCWLDVIWTSLLVTMPKTTGLRKKYSATFKLAVVKTAKSSSVYVAARSHSVDESMVWRWKWQENQLLVAERSSTSRGEKRSRLSGGKVSQFTDLEAQLFEWLVGERQQRRRVTRKSVRAKAKQLHTEAGTAEQFSASAGWCANFFMRFRLTMRMKTHQSQRSPEDLIPTLTEFLLYLKKYFADHPAMTKSSIFAMDETAVWFDSTGSRTVEVIGAQSVPLASTGHDKANVTVALCAAADGKKLLPYIIFKGKGKTAEDKELKASRDIVVSYSDNGWFNSDLTVDWLKRVMGTFAFVRRLLIWGISTAATCVLLSRTLVARRILTVLLFQEAALALFRHRMSAGTSRSRAPSGSSMTSGWQPARRRTPQLGTCGPCQSRSFVMW